jgi:hypothetical protein
MCAHVRNRNLLWAGPSGVVHVVRRNSFGEAPRIPQEISR